jgi:hypothetical protein
VLITHARITPCAIQAVVVSQGMNHFCLPVLRRGASEVYQAQVMGCLTNTQKSMIGEPAFG